MRRRFRLVGISAQWASLATAAVLGGLLFAFVDLSPKVEGDFFFSTDDPQFRDSLLMARTFHDVPQVLVAVHANPLFSRTTLSRVTALTRELAAVDGVVDVFSLTHGPEQSKGAERDPEGVRREILESPFWKRLLLSPDRTTAFLVVQLAEQDDPRREAQLQGATIRAIDAVLARHERADFDLGASGVPYVAEHIRADLTHDLKMFTIAAFLAFTLILLLIFHSPVAVAGMLTAALIACFATFLARATLGMATGILIPNLWTIAFVLTLSHVVFLTASYRRQVRKLGQERALVESMRQTGPAAVWSLAANLLGFTTLIFVAAKPLREFGLSGAIAAVIALAAAFLAYPPFLAAVPAPAREPSAFTQAAERFFLRRHPWIALAWIVMVAALVPFNRRVDADPSLPSYLARGSEVRAGLERIDRCTGSSPLDLAVRDARGGTLADQNSFERLRALQSRLERHPDVGSVVSIASLMEETKRPWYSFLFSWRQRIEALDDPERGQVGRAFLSEDRLLGRFLIRMHEETRNRPRREVVDEISALVREQGLEPEIIGGAYHLQSAMSELVRASVLRGLGILVVLFFAITLLTSHSLRSALAMGFCLAIVPIALYGIVGLVGMPLDIISAPAANVALPMGIDEMIHLGYAARRARKQAGVSGREAWRRALAELWGPAFVSMVIVISGFSLFLFSRFPPTRHLGALVCVGAVLTDLAVLVLLPTLATARPREIVAAIAHRFESPRHAER